jgi:Peptidase family M23
MRRLVALLPVLAALQVGATPAFAWTWPVEGPVLQPFVLGDDPYAAGQHRGVDLGARAGSAVRAAAGGEVTFAGTVPGGGLTLTVRTADGYAVTLLHLGSLALERGGTVGEGDMVGTIGPSGAAEHAEPYVHLGIRLAADPHGYVDPLTLLPHRTAPEPPPAEPPQQSGNGEPSAPAAGEAGEPRAGTGSAPALAHRGRPAPTRVLGHGGTGTPAVRRVAASDRLRERRTPRTPDPARPQRERFRFEPALLARSGSGQAADSSPAPALKRGSNSLGRATAGVALALGLGLAAAALAIRLGQLQDARTADRPPAVLLDLSGASAEDTVLPGPAENDRVLLDEDLEGVLLRQSKTLANLDRNDDSAELVHVPHDSRCPHSSHRAQRRAHCQYPRRRRRVAFPPA